MAGTTSYFGISYPTNTDYVKDGATAMQTIATGFDSAVAIPTYNNQTGTTYTFVLADTGKTVTASNASASTYTIPPQSSVAWASGATLTVRNLGAGVVTFAGGVGVTVTNTAATLGQYTSAKLIRTGSDAWTIVPEGSSSGLTLIKTQTIGSAVSSVAVTGVFSSTYDNYLIQVSGGSASVNDRFKLQLGSTTTGYYYNNFYLQYTSGAVQNFGGVNTSSIDYVGSLGTDAVNASITVLSPNLAKLTMVEAFFAYTGTGNLAGKTMGIQNTTTQYTDFTLIPNSGTMTGGTIRVYGYKNS